MFKLLYLINKCIEKMECNWEHLPTVKVLFEVLYLSISISGHFALPLFEANIVVTPLHLFYNFSYKLLFWLHAFEANTAVTPLHLFYNFSYKLLFWLHAALESKKHMFKLFYLINKCIEKMECNWEHLPKNCTVKVIFEVLYLSISIFCHFALLLFEANIVVTPLYVFYNFS